MSNSLQTLELIRSIADDYKPVEPVIFDMRGITPVFDFCLICGATSGAHLRGICENLEKRMRKLGNQPLGLEGADEGIWAVLDFDAVAAHVLQLEERERLNLEELFEERGGKRIEPEN